MGEARAQVFVGEWLWRFLAAVMVFAVGWTLWIIYQLNPPPLVTEAAFEAAAKAKLNLKQSSQGVIVPATPAAAGPAPAAEGKEPPINADKLKFSEELSAPDKK